MIITEIRNFNGTDYRYTYSTEGRYVICDDGRVYENVYDRIDIIHEYTEGDLIPIEEPTEEEMAEAGRVMMGYSHS